MTAGEMTFFFSDVEGSTSKWDRAREAMEQAMGQHDAIVASHIDGAGGRVIKKTGDGFLAVFDSASNAVRASAEIQRQLASQDWGPELDGLAVRIGMNTGPARAMGDDFLGPALNRAARIEAAGHGGQILVAEATKTEAADVDVEFVDLGDHFLRGLTRQERIFQIAGAGLRRHFPPLRTESKPYRPSIAVLPFRTGDEERQYFADGLTEDLIIELSRSKDLFVVARNSTSAYKDRQDDPVSVAKELDVRYLLEGTVRWAGDTVRVSAHLIDGSNGGHVWAERYDHSVVDVLSVLDSITEDIVSHLAGYHGAIVLSEKKRTLSQDPGSLGDYEAYIYGLELKHRFQPETNVEARQIFETVLEHRPSFARAHVAVAWTWLFEVWWGWTQNPETSVGKAWEHANRAVELDSNDAEVHWLLGELHMIAGDHARAEAEYQRAKDLNPNLADVRAGWAGTANKLGKPEEAVESIELAMSLNPNYPAWYDQFYGAALYGARRYEESAEVLQAAPAHTVVSLAYLAAALERLGRHDEAQEAVRLAEETVPGVTVSLLEQFEAFRDPQDQVHLSEAVAAAGLPS